MSNQAGKQFQQIPLTDRRQLIDYIRKGFKDSQLIGFENEKPVICYDEQTGRVKPATYQDIKLLLLTMFNRHSHRPLYEVNDLPENGSMIPDGQRHRHLVGFESKDRRAGTYNITIEPASQFEISGSPCATLHDMAREYHEHLEECREACEMLGMNMLTLGAHPEILASNLPLVPKKRYQIFLDALHRCQLGPSLATATATTQVNLDIRDDEDFKVKLQTGLALQPIITAMFANSPFEQGTETGYLTMRNNYWIRTGLKRTGIPDFVYEEDFGLEKWVDFLFDEVRMLSIKRGEDIKTARGGFLQKFMDGAYSGGYMPDEGNLYNADMIGQTARLSDAIDICTTVWTEVRPTARGGIEFRGCDNGTPENNVAIAAIWTGLMYDDPNLHELHQWVMSWTSQERQELLRGVTKKGLNFVFKGRYVREYAEELCERAREGLERRAQRLGIQSEVTYLQPAIDIAKSGITPADGLLYCYHSGWKDDFARIYEDQTYWPAIGTLFRKPDNVPGAALSSPEGLQPG